MVFSSNLFIFFFLPFTIWGYYFLPNKLRNVFLLVMSLVFFAWSQPKALWVILVNILVNYFAARIMMYCKNKLKTFILILVITINLGLLIYFKYTMFLLDCWNHVSRNAILIPEVILPIGISFFTFQGMSYVIDVYRGNAAIQKKLHKLALYIVLFPQLIAGPIVRYTDIANEIEERTIDLEDFTAGIERFIYGLAKKVILANTLAEIVDAIWSRGYLQNTISIAWLGSIAYSLQIYYDFSGYSDMAIGLGRMFGFHFGENFTLPYISQNITEFWRRWHISLSSWFRDYVYIPLGGNRRHVYLNLAIVFLLTGIWHGAAWHYVVWGIWHGFFILLERYLKKKNTFSDLIYSKTISTWLKRFYTLFVVNLGWVLFRGDTLHDCFCYIKTMFGIDLGSQPGVTIGAYTGRFNIFVIIIAIVFATSIPTKIKENYQNLCDNNQLILATHYLVLIVLFLFSLLRIMSGTYNPFIYFQF